jgi:hypothetical protein
MIGEDWTKLDKIDEVFMPYWSMNKNLEKTHVN